MALPGHEFLTAHFSNNERTTVESYWVTPDGLETRVEYIEANPEDTAWKKLLTHIDIDSLHENTYQHIKKQNNIHHLVNHGHLMIILLLKLEELLIVEYMILEVVDQKENCHISMTCFS